MVVKKIMGWLPYLGLICMMGLFSACSTGSSAPATQQTPASIAVNVNGFGTAANHVHSLLALPNHVLVLATHYGLFRSEDDGATWIKVAAGNNQLMQGLMTYSLGYSPVNPQRMYVLTQVAVNPHAGTLGLYTSADQGKTWKLAIATASITPGAIYLEEPGNDTPDEIYIYLPDLGALGLKVSLDAGQHFSNTGTLPFGNILGLLAVPGAPGQLLAYSGDGLARSSDGGAHWQVVKGITGGIEDMATAGPHSPIYASGDEGIFSSLDGGKSFKLVAPQINYASLTVSPLESRYVYGKTGLAVYQSSNGGRTWSALPHISGNLAVLAADPSNVSMVYLSLSYPTAVYQLQQNRAGWHSLTPQP
jgi:photosystem II stability/assembly factor-like uncharacterized protein